LLVSLAGALLLSVRAVSSQELPAQGKSIRVQISGLHSDKGQVLCALFPSASAAAFPKKPEASIAQSKSDITNWQALCEFHGIEAGTYAISAIHDENSNGRLDTNFMGIPKEGVGASNDAKGHFGPPKFDAAAFHFDGGRLGLKITIVYLHL
jgi:uncharacterized protein (DUF2141 family)